MHGNDFEEYRKLRNEVKSNILRDKLTRVDPKCEALGSFSRDKTYFKAIKNTTKKKKSLLRYKRNRWRN